MVLSLVRTLELCIDTVQGRRQDYRQIQGQGGLKGSESFLSYVTKSKILSFGRKNLKLSIFVILCTTINLRSSTGILISFHDNNRI